MVAARVRQLEFAEERPRLQSCLHSKIKPPTASLVCGFCVQVNRSCHEVKACRFPGSFRGNSEEVQVLRKIKVGETAEPRNGGSSFVTPAALGLFPSLCLSVRQPSSRSAGRLVGCPSAGCHRHRGPVSQHGQRGWEALGQGWLCVPALCCWVLRSFLLSCLCW